MYGKLQAWDNDLAKNAEFHALRCIYGNDECRSTGICDQCLEKVSTKIRFKLFSKII